MVTSHGHTYPLSMYSNTAKDKDNGKMLYRDYVHDVMYVSLYYCMAGIYCQNKILRIRQI